MSRPPQHTGEHVRVEPLARFLRRAPDGPPPGAPAAPKRLPSLDDYDNPGEEP